MAVGEQQTLLRKVMVEVTQPSFHLRQMFVTHAVVPQEDTHTFPSASLWNVLPQFGGLSLLPVSSHTKTSFS